VALCADNYDVVVTDANGCSTSPATTNFVIAPIAPIVPAGSVSVFNMNGYHVSCNGANDGSITANASGGTGTFTYSIDGTNFQSNALFSGLIAGNYTITYKDANDCIATEAHTLNEPLALSGTANITQIVDCFGTSTGEITFDVDPLNPGVPPYQYSTDNGSNYQSSNIFNNLTGNVTYNIMIEDNNGCQYTSSIYLAEPAQIIYSPVLSDYNGYEVSCNGNSDGEIEFGTPIGGTAPLEYSIDNGLNYFPASFFNLLIADSYDLIIRDANLCTEPITVVLDEPGIFTIPTLPTNPICFEDCNGTVAINPANAVGQVVYTLDAGAQQTTPSYSGLCGDITNPTPYVIDATDDNGCIAQETVSLSEPTDFVYTIPPSTDEYCSQSNGMASISVTSGGTGGYSYSWNDGQTSATATNLIAGNYHVTVTDGNGCQFTENVTVGTDIGFTVSFTTVSPCLGPNSGSATVSATGTPPYTYQWYDNNGAIVGASSATAINLPVGTYTVDVTDVSGAGCTITGTVDIIAPVNPIQIDSLIITPSSCYGADDAQIEILASGGQSTYTYSKTGGLNTQNNPVFPNLSPGSYTIHAIDANGCYADSTITLDYPDLLVIDSVVFSHVSCFGADDGEITDIQFVGGTGPDFEYYVDNGIAQTYMNFSGLDPAQHSVHVIDVNGCISQFYITIEEPTELVVDITASNWNNYQIRCHDDNSGYVDVNATGGTLPYYTIYNQFYSSSNFTVNGAVLDSVQFSDTTYVHFWDTITNTLDSSLSTLLEIIEFNDAATPTNPTDTLYAFESGFWNMEFDSIGNIIDSTYLDADSTWLLSYFDLSAIDTAFGTNSQMTGFPQGNHTFIVEDANGCNYTETIMFNEPSPIQHNFITNHVTCVAWNNGSVTDSVSGGVGSATTYSYLWTTGDTTFQLTDSTTYSLDNLQADTYTITVTDENGCEDLASVIINDTNALRVDSLRGSNVGCFDDCDGKLEVFTVNGGSPGLDASGNPVYNYLWDDYLAQNSSEAVGLCVDSIALISYYTCIVSDAAGCSDTVEFTLEQPAELQVEITIDQPISCNGYDDGELSANVTGGEGVSSYSWNTGSTDQNIINLILGTYKVTIEDANGCRDTFEMYLNEPTPVSVDIAEFDISCFGIDDGYITTLGAGGTSFEATYSYSLYLESTIYPPVIEHVAGTLTQDSLEFENLPPGNYYIIVEDRNDCSDTSITVEIIQPSELTLMVDSVNETCNLDDGIVRIFPEGGSPQYDYFIDGNPTLNNENYVTGNSPGWYVVKVVDDNGCWITDSTFIRDYLTVFLNPDTVNFIDTTICLGQSINIYIDSLPGLTYSWNDGVLTGDRIISPDTVLAFGQNLSETYILTITDENDCSQDVMVDVISTSSIDAMPASNPGVEYGNFPVVLNGESIEIYSDNNNCQNYTWTWTLDTVNNKSTVISPGNTSWYYINVEDSEGCLGYDSIYVVVGVKPYEAITPNNDGFNDTWTPLDIESYEKSLVQVFSRWGALVFESTGGTSYQPWDGTNEGAELPVGTYYYIIDLNTGDEPQTGPITIIR
jgi:gliding motility-associated-like protein